MLLYAPRIMRHSRFNILLATGVAALGVAGCGSGMSAMDTAKAFVAATGNADTKTMCALASPAMIGGSGIPAGTSCETFFNQQLASNSNALAIASIFKKASVVDVKVLGNTASAAVHTANGGIAPLPLLETKDGWRVNYTSLNLS